MVFYSPVQFSSSISVGAIDEKVEIKIDQNFLICSWFNKVLFV